MLKKIGFAILGLFVLLLLSAIILPIIYKDKIVQLVKDEANKNLNATLNFGDFDITLIKSFPNFTLSINDLSVAGVEEFRGDTLLSSKNFALALDVMSVIKGEQIGIRAITLQDPRIHALVLKNGKANWDIAKASADTTPTTPEESSKFKIKLKKLEIINGFIVYDDASLGFASTMAGLDHQLEGDFTQDNFIMSTLTDIKELSVSYEGVKYLSKTKSHIVADLEMDMLRSKYTFKKSEMTINELVVGADGWVAMPADDIDMDVTWKVAKSDFKNFMSLVPGAYTADFASVKTSGSLAMDGLVKGRYNDKQMPGFALNLLIQNGNFQYPALPAALKNVQVDLKVNNPDGVPDHTLINLSRMHLELAGDPFDMRLIVKTPVSDAQIDASMKGRINLANVAQLVPMDKGTKLSGLFTADLTAKGRMSSIEKERYEEFNAAGSMTVSNVSYSSPDMPQGAQIRTMALAFNPKNVTLSAFDARMGRSDIQMSGSLDNFLAYALKDETLKGSLSMTSKQIDMNEFMSDEPATATPAAPDTSAMTVFEVPKNINFNLNANIDKLLYEDLVVSSMKGAIVLGNETVSMNDVSMRILGGTVSTTGRYSTSNPRRPTIVFDLDVAGMDVQQTAKYFNTVKKMAPIVEKTMGSYSTKFKVTGTLDEHMQPILNTLNGGGNLITQDVVVNGFAPMVKVGEALKMKKLERLVVGSSNLSFEFADGRIRVKPFDVKMGDTKVNIAGSNGFDQTIDYTLKFEIPRAEFGTQANNVLTGLVAQANSKGANFSVGDVVKVDVKIGGTMTDPKIITGLNGAASNAVNDLKDKAKEELDKKKKELEDKAKVELDKKKQEAEAQVNKARQDAENKAKAEAERVKKEAEDKAKAEAEKAKKEASDKAKKEAEKKLKGLFK